MRLFEGPNGLERMFAQTIPADWDDPSLEVVKQTVLKKFCALIHGQPVLEATLELKRKHGLSSGDVDVYVDYSGTIWSDDMKRRDLPPRAKVLSEMAAWLKRTRGIGYVGPLGFENAYAFAMRGDRAATLHIRSLADLALYAPRMKIGGDYEIFSRPEWRSVERAYGVKFAVERQYQSNFMYRAVQTGDVDVISAFSSDGRIAQYGLRLLSDPKGALICL